MLTTGAKLGQMDHPKIGRSGEPSQGNKQHAATEEGFCLTADLRTASGVLVLFFLQVNMKYSQPLNIHKDILEHPRMLKSMSSQVP